MSKIANEMDARKPFDIEEMLRDILSIPPIVPGRLERDERYQEELKRRAG